LGIHKPSHLRRTIFGPSSGGLYGSCVVRLVAKINSFSVTLPQMTRLRPTYVIRHMPFLARLVFANEKAWLYTHFDKAYCYLLFPY